jgi:hypothetical protein
MIPPLLPHFVNYGTLEIVMAQSLEAVLTLIVEVLTAVNPSSGLKSKLCP